MFFVVNGCQQGSMQCWVHAGRCISHGTADGQVGCPMLLNIWAVNAFCTEEDAHNVLWGLCRQNKHCWWCVNAEFGDNNKPCQQLGAKLKSVWDTVETGHSL